MGCEKLYLLFKIHSCEDNTSPMCTIDHLLHLGFKSNTFSADDQGNTIYIEYDK